MYLIFCLGFSLTSFGQVVGGNSVVLPQSSGVTVTAWTSFTMTVRGSGSNPTKASSPARDFARWRRVGDTMEVYYDYAQTATTGAANGTGVYVFSLPPTYSSDSNKVYDTSQSGTGVVGNGMAQVGTSAFGCQVLTYDTTGVSLKCQDPTAASGSMFDAGATATGFTNNATVRYTLRFSIPISGWGVN